MKLKQKASILIATLICIVTVSCFSSKEVTLIKRGEIPLMIGSPTKAYLKDASLILFSSGFTFKNDTISGFGKRYWLDRSDERMIMRVIPIDSVAAMAYYEWNSSPGTQFGSFLLGLFGGVMTSVSIKCLTCPKCCFGSCPTIYTYENNKYNLEAELFSYSISKYFQESDLDMLSHKIPKDGKYKIRVSNEALETHYINKLSLIAVNHSASTQIFPLNNGGFVSTSKLQQPAKAFNSIGENILPLVRNSDEHWYRSTKNMVRKLNEGVYSDWVEVLLKVPEETSSIKLVLRLKNTLLSTILFYDVVLASQGLRALEWTEKINTDQRYAAQFNALFKSYSGIRVMTEINGTWTEQTVIGDIGPIAWKYTAVEIPVDGMTNGEVRVRLQFFPDNFMIDYVAFETNDSSSESFSVKAYQPKEIYDDAGLLRNDVLDLVADDDERFLVTSPGESYHFIYDIPPESDYETTVFLQSKGYYTEWIRGEWLNNKETGYRFNLFDVDKAIIQLGKSWLENRDIIEKEFFKARIPLKGGI